MARNVIKAKKHVHSVADVFGKILFSFTWILLVILVVSTLIYPIYMLITSLKLDTLECIMNPFGFPTELKVSNYGKIFEVFNEYMDTSLLGIFAVSLATAGIKPLLGVLVTTIWGYVMAKYKFFGRNFIFQAGIIFMILPIVGSTASTMIVYKALGVYDNLFMHIFTAPLGGFYGTNFLLMYGTFKAIPWDYAEAAQIDGASRYTIFFKIYLRMALPQATVLYVLGFMGAWNDYLTFMVWLPSYPNIAYGMYLFQENASIYYASIPELMAGFTLVMIPIAVIYLSTQKIITSKFVVGGLKG